MKYLFVASVDERLPIRPHFVRQGASLTARVADTQYAANLVARLAP